VSERFADGSEVDERVKQQFRQVWRRQRLAVGDKKTAVRDDVVEPYPAEANIAIVRRSVRTVNFDGRAGQSERAIVSGCGGNGNQHERGAKNVLGQQESVTGVLQSAGGFSRLGHGRSSQTEPFEKQQDANGERRQEDGGGVHATTAFGVATDRRYGYDTDVDRRGLRRRAQSKFADGGRVRLDRRVRQSASATAAAQKLGLFVAVFKLRPDGGRAEFAAGRSERRIEGRTTERDQHGAVDAPSQ